MLIKSKSVAGEDHGTDAAGVYTVFCFVGYI